MNVDAVMVSPSGTEGTMRWATDASEARAIVAVAQLMEQAKDESPWAPRILEIRVTL